MDNVEKVSNKYKEFMSIVKFFKRKGAKEVVLKSTVVSLTKTNSEVLSSSLRFMILMYGVPYDVIIVVTDWYRHDMRGKDICDMVDKFIEECPKTKYFILERHCNCVYVIYKDIHED